MEYKKLAACFKAMGDETRVQIVDMLKGGKMCACKILERFKISQPTLSYHMKMLVDCGLVEVEKEGTWSYYTANIKVLNELTIFIIKKCEPIKGACDC